MSSIGWYAGTSSTWLIYGVLHGIRHLGQRPEDKTDIRNFVSPPPWSLKAYVKKTDVNSCSLSTHFCNNVKPVGPWSHHGHPVHLWDKLKACKWLCWSQLQCTVFPSFIELSQQGAATWWEFCKMPHFVVPICVSLWRPVIPINEGQQKRKKSSRKMKGCCRDWTLTS